jgi:REP element-mobilizing transposase RayT
MPGPAALREDAFYHIYARGTNRENLFFEERNYEHFMRLYDRHVAPVVETFAYCLLRNHFHLLVRVNGKEKTLRVYLRPLGSESERPLGSIAFSNFLNAYAKAINRAYQRTGSLFEHPFGRVEVTTNKQLWAVIAYIHQNPQKHGLIDDFRDWR